MKADLHNHSMYSPDGLSKPASLVRAAKERGIDCLALTDHNAVVGWKSVQAEAKKQGLLFIPGEEIKVLENGKSAGEILGFFLNEPIEPGPAGDILDAIRQQGGLASIAHPFDSFRHPFVRLDEFRRKVDAIETFNAGCFFSGPNQKAAVYAKAHSLSQTAGSDSHHPSQTGRAFIEIPGDDLESLRHAIQKGKTCPQGTRSPFYAHAFISLRKMGILKPV
jgi:predicted metal-dependent phosphoesterase TrpH